MIPNYVDLTESVNGSLKNLLIAGNYTHIAILCDENTLENCYPLIRNELPEHHIIEIDSGELNKNISTCESIWNTLTLEGFDRNSLLINLGGGVIGDMGGFCAATFKRGVEFIQVPTTLLAQVDASIGGKLGIDFNGLKNHIGVFQLPAQVIIDPIFLKTLPDRQIRSGYAEIIKHGLIRDKTVFENLRKANEISSDDWLTTIEESVSIKGTIVESDPLEKGARKLLNFGHTIGHAIESYFLGRGENELLHGEAVAIGMICESYLSTKKLNFVKDDLVKIKEYILGVYGKVNLQEMNENEFAKSLRQDKKNKGNKILFTLLEEIGEGKFDISISPDEALESLEYYNSL